MVCTAVQISGSNLSDMPGSGQTSKETRMYFRLSCQRLSGSHIDGMHLGTVSKSLDTTSYLILFLWHFILKVQFSLC